MFFDIGSRGELDVIFLVGVVIFSNIPVELSVVVFENFCGWCKVFICEEL